MTKAKAWMAVALCSVVVALTAVTCQSRNETTGEVSPGIEEQLDDQPVVIDSTEPAPGVTPGPGTTPAPTPGTPPSSSPPEPGVGGTGTAVNPPQAAQLIASQPGSQINLRSQPTTTSDARGYGLVGDPVQLLRSADRSDGTWYFVKFETSGAEGWIRGDFINIAGRATPLPQQANQSSTCTGTMEAMTFTAFYDGNGFNLVRFVNLETQNTFDGTLSRQGSNNQGQPLYRGTMSPPTGGSYPVELTDLSGGNPRSGSQVAIDYEGIEGTGTCR
ncbi:SH3 domain-containing protein [Nodosilinea sp. E11]|uniref:SH3 domain-containing protein n=1 Tax=Nodosilinea sp. E11 TaxID=3037479 RepID=UPI0029341DE1|nr:SH3 domain-containing protein [Nodosilinea sp. E11]WOD40913.1 SH3 domain-containing protein [Nodosilinea sp. E11]